MCQHSAMHNSTATAHTTMLCDRGLSLIKLSTVKRNFHTSLTSESNVIKVRISYDTIRYFLRSTSRILSELSQVKYKDYSTACLNWFHMCARRATDKPTWATRAACHRKRAPNTKTNLINSNDFLKELKYSLELHSIAKSLNKESHLSCCFFSSSPLFTINEMRCKCMRQAAVIPRSIRRSLLIQKETSNINSLHISFDFSHPQLSQANQLEGKLPQ